MQMSSPLFAVGARTPFLRSTRSWKFCPAMAACISGMRVGFTMLVRLGGAAGAGAVTGARAGAGLGCTVGALL